MLLVLATTLPARAQMSDNGYASVDWQYNFPVGNSFANHSSGWGMHVEGGYYLNDHWGLGLFLAWHTNHEYIPRTVLPLSPTESLSTDQQHSNFRLPFGVAGRYSWNRGGAFQPYVSVKAGAQYARLSSAFNIFEAKDRKPLEVLAGVNSSASYNNWIVLLIPFSSHTMNMENSHDLDTKVDFFE